MANDNSRGVSTEGQPRRPYWLVGVVLLALVVAMLVGAFILDKQLRPRVGIVPTTSTVPMVVPAADRKTTAQPASVPTSVAAVVPSTTTVPADPRAATTSLEREIEDAYLKYWDVRIQAYLNLDASRLADVMAGPKLERETNQIRELREQGKAAKLEVDHRIALVKVSPDHAVVYDEYLNRSVFVDPATKQELPTTVPPETEKISFEMRKIDGTWKVVDGARHD